MPGPRPRFTNPFVLSRAPPSILPLPIDPRSTPDRREAAHQATLPCASWITASASTSTIHPGRGQRAPTPRGDRPDVREDLAVRPHVLAAGAHVGEVCPGAGHVAKLRPDLVERALDAPEGVDRLGVGVAGGVQPPRRARSPSCRPRTRAARPAWPGHRSRSPRTARPRMRSGRSRSRRLRPSALRDPGPDRGRRPGERASLGLVEGELLDLDESARPEEAGNAEHHVFEAVFAVQPDGDRHRARPRPAQVVEHLDDRVGPGRWTRTRSCGARPPARPRRRCVPRTRRSAPGSAGVRAARPGPGPATRRAPSPARGIRGPSPPPRRPRRPPRARGPPGSARNRGSPAMPRTRSRGNPVASSISAVISSRGFETTMTTAPGAAVRIVSATARTVRRLASRRSARSIPGARGRPAVTTTTSAPAASARSTPPETALRERVSPEAWTRSRASASARPERRRRPRSPPPGRHSRRDGPRWPRRRPPRPARAGPGGPDSAPSDAPAASTSHRGGRGPRTRAAVPSGAGTAGRSSGPVRKRDPEPRCGLAGGVGDDGPRQHLEVAPAAAARPLDVLGPDHAPARHQPASRPSTPRTAAADASIAVSTEASLPEMNMRP